MNQLFVPGSDDLQYHKRHSSSTVHNNSNIIPKSYRRYSSSAVQNNRFSNMLNKFPNTQFNLNLNRALGIKDDGLYELAEFLRTNNTVTDLSLNLSKNRITVDGIKIFAKGLQANNSLNKVELVDGYIGLEGAKHLANALKFNNTLEILNLNRVSVGPTGADIIAKAMEGQISKTIIQEENKNREDNTTIPNTEEVIEASNNNNNNNTGSQ
eukprot:Pgem_evm1s279